MANRRASVILAVAGVALFVSLVLLAVIAARALSSMPAVDSPTSDGTPSASGEIARPTKPTPSPNSEACQGRDPSANIYRSQRLIVLERCITALGTVLSVRREPDGDLHVQLRLDPGQESLLNRGNLGQQSGTLVVEFICVGVVTQNDAVESCATYSNPLEIPAVGAHILLTGPHVLDTHHDWMEIHPVYEWHTAP